MSVQPVRAIVSSDIDLRDLSPRSRERLRFLLSYPHPEYVRSLRMGRGGKGVPTRFECMTEMPDGSVHVPRGAMSVVRGALAEDLIPIQIEDRRSSGDSLGPMPEVPMRAYQRSGIIALQRKTQGMIVLPCGGGKTRLGVGAISVVRRTTLVVVHTDDLLDQWCEEIRSSFGIEPGIVNEAHKDLDRPIVVASVFSLAKLLEADPSACARFGFVIIDECHHVPAATLQRVLGQIPARNRLGLSATPDREDGHSKLVGWSLGPILLQKTLPQLVADGFLVMPKISIIETNFSHDVDPDDKKRIVKLERALIADKERNEKIVDLAVWDAQAGESVLVLSNRKVHCRKLAKMITAAGSDVKLVLGTTKKSERKESLEQMRTGDAAIIVATSLADEGLNIPRLSRVILAFPEKARGKTVQRAGRLTRLWGGKEPVLYDIVDGQVEMLARRAAERRRAYRSQGMMP